LLYHAVVRRSCVPSPAFLCDCHGAPRALPSFPTRRSSDLSGSVVLRLVIVTPAWAARCVTKNSSSVIWPKRTSAGTATGCAPKRSEEHTSELQSRENLVCRLLLEKKKNKQESRRTETAQST